MAIAVEVREARAVYVIHQAGVDQIRVVLSLSGDVARFCETLTEHDWRPRGIPNMRFVGRPRQDGFKKVFDHFLGEDARLLYHRDSANLHVDVHFQRLAPVTAAVEQVRGVVERLAGQGVSSVFPVRVARADFTGDVLFSSSDYYRYVTSAFRAMLCDRGRVIDPFRSSTLYLNASTAAKSKRLGRIYDKGLERTKRARWTLPQERYMRIEAEQVWEADRPLLDSLNSEEARRIFLDRFGAVGRGTLVLKRGLVEPLMDLLREGAISIAQYERLYVLLDHARMGLTDQLYDGSRDTFSRRTREARELGLEVPGLDDEPQDELAPPLDVRQLVHEIARSF